MTAIAAPIKTLSVLQKATESPQESFRLSLADGSELLCLDMLRFLPGKRMVMRANYQGNTVLAKLFFDTRNLRKEVDGYHLLQGASTTTPRQLAAFPLDGGGVCLYEFITPAEPLDSLWQKSSTPDKTLLLEKVLAALEQCYQSNVLQQDLHLGNFLLRDDALYVLDPASCATCNNTEAQADNLALLLAQLPFADWQNALVKIEHRFPAVRNLDLTHRARRCWQKRQRDYLAKVFRACSDVADLSSDSLRILCRRQHLDHALSIILREPAALISNATELKNGNSAKVFVLTAGDKKLVVKQYINKDWLRRIRRAFRPSRAARSWYFAHAFSFAGISVPEPVALIEQRRGPFVTSAWYISEFAHGRDLLGSWQESAPSIDELSAIHSLFLSLQLIMTSHGDMKATNLITDGSSIALIDYDGAREHSRASSLSRALQNDKQRFLQNWSDNPVLQTKLQELLDA